MKFVATLREKRPTKGQVLEIFVLLLEVLECPCKKGVATQLALKEAVGLLT